MKNCDFYFFQVIPECVFMTDSQPPKSTYPDAIQTEHNNSTEISDFKTSKEEYNLVYVTCWIIFYFHFLILMLRMDDGDYLFLYWSIFPELPIPMEQRFHRGWTHSVRYAVRPEESMLLFFSQFFLLQDPISLNSEVKPPRGTVDQELKL